MTEFDELKAELAALKAELAVIRVQTAYGYYVDKAQWDEAADLFARLLPPLEHETGKSWKGPNS